jgi:membrane protein
MNPGTLWSHAISAYDFVVEVFAEFGKDRGGTLAAALAFYAAFSIFPLLLGLIAVAAMFVSRDQAQELVFQYSQTLLASQRDFLGGTVAGVVEARGTLGLVAGALLLWSGKSLFMALQDTLETVYGIARLGGVWGAIWANVRAMAFTVLTSLAIVGLAGLTWGLEAVMALNLPWLLDLPRDLVARAMDWFKHLLPPLTALCGITAIYRYLPARRIAWRQALLSGLVATALWVPVSALLGWYLNAFARLNAVYGPLAGVMGFLLWLQLTSTIVLLAAETGAVWCRRMTGVKSM